MELMIHHREIRELLDWKTGKKTLAEDLVDEAYLIWRGEHPEGYDKFYEQAETRLDIVHDEVYVYIIIPEAE